MTGKISMTMTGSAELAKKLEQITDEMVAANSLELAGHAGAMPIINEAKQKVRKKTRTLSRSIHSETAQKRRSLVEIDIGTDVVYARIHEYGGTIRPKKGKYLAIPWSSTAKALVSPRNYGGKLVKAGMTLQDSEGTVHWILALSVTITAQPYMRPAFDHQSERALSDAGKALGQILATVAAR